MPYCTACGHLLPDAAGFCPACGAKVETTSGAFEKSPPPISWPPAASPLAPTPNPAEPSAPQPSEPEAEPSAPAADEPQRAAIDAPAPPEPELPDHVAGALAYVTFIPAVVFLVMEPFRRRRFVRFHSIQSILLWLLSMLGGWLRGHVGGAPALRALGRTMGEAWNIAVLCLVVFCAIQALMKREWRLPVLGEHAARIAGE